MKNALNLAAAAALLAAIALPSVAQDAGAGAIANAPAGEVNAAIAEAIADETYGGVMSSVARSAEVDLAGIADEGKVTIVLLSSLQGNAETEAAALDAVLADHAESVATLHSNIDTNAAIKAKLEAEGHSAEDVVAVKSNADGSVLLYVDDRA